MILHLAPDTPLLIRALAGAALVTHIGGASLGIVSGMTALIARKGRRLHRISGHVFFGAMLAMSAVATVVAPMLHDSVSALMGAFTFYLTATAWLVVRRRPASVGRFEMAAGVYALGVATVAFAIGQIGSHMPRGLIGGQPHQIAYVLAGVAALAAVSDFRVVRQGGLIGPPRIARHLWRMCLALFIVTGSAAAQPKVVQFLPHSIQGSALTMVPALAVLALMVFWLIRIRVPKRVRAQPRPQPLLAT
jgi:predicted amino acid-binding ACT domain protein